MIRFLAIASLTALLACGESGSDMPQRLSPATTELPPMKVFAPHPTAAPRQSNGALARDFLELSFYMESGRRLPRFTRFEGPITVRLTGIDAPPSIERDLKALLGRLRNEAGIDISRVGAGEPASITIETIPRRALKRAVPQAACFVVPNASSWKEFLKLRRGHALDWARLETRTRAAIFLPGDVSPQEVRDCLHEELAQALGPVNDLYRLPQSIFNDDNIHAVLTGFDMMMLRVTYDRSLHSGMSRAEVASRLPGILARINPRGGYEQVAPPIETPRMWVELIETAIGSNAGERRRIAAAEQALAIAQAGDWNDARLGFSLYVLARVVLPQDGNLSLASFFRASAVYGASTETALQAAHVGMQLAAFALSSNDPEAALSIINRNLDIVKKSENAALLSSLLLMKAEALDALDRPSEATATRREGLGWGRYGFGSRTAVQQRAAEIATLSAGMTRGAS